jgi:hypothetical protein
VRQIASVSLPYTRLSGLVTEAGDANLTDTQIRAQGRHTSAKVLPKYVKRTTRQVAEGAKKRRAARTDGGHLSE